MSQLSYTLNSLPSMTTKRSCCAAVVTANGTLCAVGGTGGWDTIELYDFNSGEWTQAPAKMSEGRPGCAVAAVGNVVYVAGGGNGLSSLEAYDIESGLWTEEYDIQPMRTGRIGAMAVGVDNKFFFVIGGVSEYGRTLATGECFNVKTGRYEDDLPPMLNGRQGSAVAVVNNKMYIIGGRHYENNTVFDSVQMLDLRTRQHWMMCPHRMTTGRYETAAAVVGRRYIVVAGGNDGTNCLNTVEVFDTESGMWSKLQPPISTERWGCGVVSLGGSVYVIGGEDKNRDDLDSVEEIQFNDDVVQRMLVEWSGRWGGSWIKDVAPILHRRNSVVHKMDLDLTLMPTLLSRVGQEGRVQTIFGIIRSIDLYTHATTTQDRSIDLYTQETTKEKKNGNKKLFRFCRIC